MSRAALIFILATSLMCLLVSCALFPLPRLSKSSRNVSSENLDLSREAFINEMITAAETPVTRHFDDYTPGSYHVDKLELVKGVRVLSDSIAKDVDAVLVYGLVGPLWQYNIVTVIDSTDAAGSVHVNHLVFPHARITAKATRELKRSEYERIWSQILASPILRSVSTADTTVSDDWSLSFVAAKFDVSQIVRVVSDSAGQNNAESMELLVNSVNELIGGDKAEITYE